MTPPPYFSKTKVNALIREYVKRIGVLLSGLAISAVGITMMLQANIGLEPWSVLQNGMSVFFGMTYGTAAMIVGAAVIAVAILCGESFGIGTLANIFFAPVCIDALLALGWIPQMQTLWGGLAMLLIGMCFIAVGIFVSTLTESPVTASIGTMGILVGFAGAAIFNNLIDTYVIRYVLSWISIYSRYVNFTYGIFDIAATLYYLSITAIFLFLAVRVYERRRYA